MPRPISWLFCIGALVLAGVAVDAGGWAVITVKDLPDYVFAGKPATLTYSVRQHGKLLLGGLDGRVEGRDGAHTVYSAATETEPGYYLATFTLPHAGDWTIEIHGGWTGGTNSSRLMLRAIATDASAPVVSDSERGRRLFAGKGCITCHAHDSVGRALENVGPALTARRYQPSYLQSFLAYPRQTESAKFGSEMPNLQLRNTEIASLVAFINGDGDSGARD